MRYYAHNDDVLSVYKVGWDTIETIMRQFGLETCSVTINGAGTRFTWGDVTAVLDDYILFDGDNNFVAVVSAKALRANYSAIEG